VPKISEFYGIVRMYYADHLPPHFHADYDNSGILVEIPTLIVLKGRVPLRVLGLVSEWAALHRDELIENWNRARAGLPLHSIEPLD
jgi:hypothetical protein